MPGFRLAGVAAVSVLFACGELAPSPHQAAERFWGALADRDTAAARELASAASAHLVDHLKMGGPIEEVLLGEVLQGESSAIVRTSIATSSGADRAHATFDTHLIREVRQWKVDVAATRRELTAAMFAASMQKIGETVGQGMQEFSEALEDGAVEINRAIQEALEALERELR